MIRCMPIASKSGEDGFSILSYADGFDASKALRTCPAVTFAFHTIGGNTYFSAQLD